MTIWAILPAAGIGRRMGLETPKQYLPLNGVPVIALALRRLAQVSSIAKIIVVLHPEDAHWSTLELANEFGPELNGDVNRISCVTGGERRDQSVWNALLSLKSKAGIDDWVLVHDAVRPCVRSDDIDHLITSLRDHDVGGLLGTPADNSLKQVDREARVLNSIDRASVWNALTPQMFRYGILSAALEKVMNQELQVTDEAAAIELMGYQPQMVLGSKDNIKITHQSDLALAAKILELQAMANHGE